MSQLKKESSIEEKVLIVIQGEKRKGTLWGGREKEAGSGQRTAQRDRESGSRLQGS